MLPAINNRYVKSVNRLTKNIGLQCLTAEQVLSELEPRKYDISHTISDRTARVQKNDTGCVFTLVTENGQVSACEIEEFV